MVDFGIQGFFLPLQLFDLPMLTPEKIVLSFLKYSRSHLKFHFIPQKWVQCGCHRNFSIADRTTALETFFGGLNEFQVGNENILYFHISIIFFISGITLSEIQFGLLSPVDVFLCK